MEHLFLECAVRAALLVAGTALVLYVMRVKAAAARHSVWASVVLLMLVLPIWTAWGPKAPLRLLPPLGQITANEAIVPAGTLSTALVPSPLLSTLQAVLLGVYLLGLCLLLFRLAIGTVRARRLVRDALLQDGMCISSICAAPVTVGFFHPTVIVPEHWRQWSQAQLDAVLTHEQEHARRRDSLVQWLALLNRALFWFHPVAWWLERHLSGLAEEACDDVVLAHGHSPEKYSEYLINIARSVTSSRARLNIAGMAMPGSFLQQRIRQIMKEGSAPHISPTKMACVAAACAITCTVFAAGTLDHARQSVSTQPQHGPSAATPATKFVLGDLRIEGAVHDRNRVKDRILKAWKDREYDDGQKLVDEVFMDGIRVDFQDRGYFKIFAHDPVWQPLGLDDGKQRILIVASLEEGDQYRLGTLTFLNVSPDQTLSIPLSIPAATLRDQFHLRNGDLFNVTEIRTGLERLKQLYGTRGYADVKAEPDTEIDNSSHRIDLILRISEGAHSP
jgi:beta-lactamase regulating signal transducer with metallopeptidase domain